MNYTTAPHPHTHIHTSFQQKGNEKVTIIECARLGVPFRVARGFPIFQNAKSVQLTCNYTHIQTHKHSNTPTH